MKSFLVAYDLGAAGLWAVLQAESRDQITKRFPTLTVMEERPENMSAEEHSRIATRESYTLAGPLPQWLADLDKR